MLSKLNTVTTVSPVGLKTKLKDVQGRLDGYLNETAQLYLVQRQQCYVIIVAL